MESRQWKEYSWPLLASVLALLVIGILALNSATLTAVTGNGAPLRPIFPRQLIYIGVGLAVMSFVSVIDYRLLSSLARPVYLAIIGLLGLVLLIGQISEGARVGSRSANGHSNRPNWGNWR